MSDLVQRRKAMGEEMMRDAICDAATAVLAQVGYAALTMDRVADAAGVSKGTLYNYFQDKDALMLEVIDRTFIPLSAAVDRVLAASGDIREKLTEVVRLILTGIDKERALGQAVCASELSPRLDAGLRTRQIRMRHRFVEVFRQAKTEGRLRAAGAAADELARFLAMTIDGVIDERMLHGDDCPGVDRDVSLIDGLLLRLWFKET